MKTIKTIQGSTIKINANRRLLLMGSLLLPAYSFATSEKLEITMWRGPKCKCCKDWASYLEKNGFTVKVNNDGNTEIRQKLDMPVQFGSCHTALINGYVIEGHVPAPEIKRLLAERPNVLGLTVPAMPLGSPGMDGPEYKNKKDPYDVLIINKRGQASVYQSYRN